MNEVDAFRAAKLLVKKHGDAAPIKEHPFAGEMLAKKTLTDKAHESV
jgi:hypothetical protein